MGCCFYALESMNRLSSLIAVARYRTPHSRVNVRPSVWPSCRILPRRPYVCGDSRGPLDRSSVLSVHQAGRSWLSVPAKPESLPPNGCGGPRAHRHARFSAPLPPNPALRRQERCCREVLLHEPERVTLSVRPSGRPTWLVPQRFPGFSNLLGSVLVSSSVVPRLPPRFELWVILSCKTGIRR